MFGYVDSTRAAVDFLFSAERDAAAAKQFFQKALQGYEVLRMVRKVQVRWLPKGDVLGQVQFIQETFRLKG